MLKYEENELLTSSENLKMGKKRGRPRRKTSSLKNPFELGLKKTVKAKGKIHKGKLRVKSAVGTIPEENISSP